MSFAYVGIGGLAQIAPFLDVLAEHFSCRNVMESVFFDQLFTLCALAAAGGAKRTRLSMVLFFYYVNVGYVSGFAVEVEAIADDEFRGMLKAM